MSHLMHGAPARALFTRLSAAGAGAALLLAGGIAVGNEVTRAFATAGEPGACTINPMSVATPVGSDAGFTIWTSGDTTLSNSETEGSIAVGGTFRVTGQNQYVVTHKIAGDAGYYAPLVDGDRTRVFVNRYGFEDQDTRIQLKREGATRPEHNGIFKVATPDPAFSFGPGESSGNAYYRGNNTNAGIVDLGTPFVDVPTARDAMTSAGTWGSYFPTTAADATAALTDATYRAPTVPAASGQIDIPLAAGAHRIQFSQIAGSEKIGLTGDATGFLYVTVSPSDVVTGTLRMPGLVDASQAKRILWDLSAVSGAVRLAAPAPVRGAVYAPDADVAVTDELFEGQIVARSFVGSSGSHEIHTYLFQGTLPCADGTTVPTTTEPSVEVSTTTEPSAEETTTEPSAEETTTEPSVEVSTTTEPSVDETTTSDGGVGDGEDDDESTDPSDGGVGDQEGDGDDELPATGAEAIGAALLALTLAGGGLALLAARRRQQA